MLYTVAKLTALVSGVAMAADHSVPHSDETEHMEEESEPQSFTALLSSDVAGLILSFCDTADWYSLKLLNLQMNRSINALIFGKWRSEIEKMIGDQSTMDGIREGIIHCDSITQVKDLIRFCESKRVCFTPRFCGKIVHFRPLVNRANIESEPTLRIEPHSEIPLDSVSREFEFHGGFANNHLIGEIKHKQALMNIHTGKVTELPPCKEARFIDDRTIVLFHGDKFQFYDLFDGEGEFFGENEFPTAESDPWSVHLSSSGVKAVVCEDTTGISYFTYENDQKEWIQRIVEYEKSEESMFTVQQFLSPDGSVLIAIESFSEKCSLVNIVDTHTGTIRHTVILPYNCFFDVILSRNGAYFETPFQSGFLLDLNTVRIVRLIKPDWSFYFSWMDDSRFWMEYIDHPSNEITHIRSLNDPFNDLIACEASGCPLNTDLLYSESDRKVWRLTKFGSV